MSLLSRIFGSGRRAIKEIGSPKFPFTSKTRELFHFAPCWDCNENDCKPDCLHHIFGRVSASSFNAAPMNNNNCHLADNGKIGGHARHMTPANKQYYLRKTITHLALEGYKPKKEDKEFLNKHASFYTLEKAVSAFDFKVDPETQLIKSVEEKNEKTA